MINARKKRLTLDLDVPLQRRLKAIAALKGTSMRQYCQSAITRELDRDEGSTVTDLPFGHEVVTRFAALQTEILKGEMLASDSVGLIREARESRTAL